MWSARRKSWSLTEQVAERLAFPAPQASYTMDSFPGELIFIPPCEGDKQVPCLFIPFTHARFIFICFHGNAEDLGKSYEFWKAIREIFQVHILAVEYPSYGICEGPCSEAGIMANAEAAMDFVIDTLGWPLDGIKLFGRSLGTGPSMALAAKYDVAGLVLVTPFLSIREIFRSQVGKIADLFTEDYFLNYKIMHEIQSQTLIIHGKEDSLIPCSHGMEIYSKIQGKKMMVCPDKMHHNTPLLEDVQMFVRPMMQFFSLPDYTFIEPELPEWVLPEFLPEVKTVTPLTDEERKDNTCNSARKENTWPECIFYRSTSGSPGESLNLDGSDHVAYGSNESAYHSCKSAHRACERHRTINLQLSPKMGDCDIFELP